MSRISDALKRSGAADMADGFQDLSLTEAGDLDLEAPPPVPAAPTEDDLVPEAFDDIPIVSEPVGPALPGTLFEDVTAKWSDKLVANPGLPSMAVEQYRRLAAILHHAQEDRGIRRVLVASALAEEGKTLTAMNLALTLSESYGRRVLLIDADLRRPGISHVLGLPVGPGLSDVLYTIEQNKLPLSRISENLSLLPAGQPTSDPMAGLTSSRMATILEQASEAFDWVIIDSPPIGVLPDAKLLAAMADGALIVIRAGVTPFGAISRAVESIGRERLLGAVLNRVEESAAAPGDYYDQRYGYGGAGRQGRGFLGRLLGRRR